MEFQKWIVHNEISFSRGRFLSSMLVFVGVTFESHRCNTFQIYHEILLMEGILHQSIWHLIPLFTGFYTSQVVQDFFHQQYYFIGLQQTSWYLVMCLTSCFRESFPHQKHTLAHPSDSSTHKKQVNWERPRPCRWDFNASQSEIWVVVDVMMTCGMQVISNHHVSTIHVFSSIWGNTWGTNC